MSLCSVLLAGGVPVEWVRLGLAGGALNRSEGWEGEANQVKPLSRKPQCLLIPLGFVNQISAEPKYT